MNPTFAADHAKVARLANIRRGLKGDREDTRFVQHCAHCGKVLVRWDSEWDGHRNERGDVLESVPSVTVRVLNARFCQSDGAKILTELATMGVPADANPPRSVSM